MDPSPCNSISSVRSNDDYDFYATKDKIVRDEKKEDTKQYTESSADAFNSKLPSENNMSSPKNDTFFSATSGSTKEEDITKDDLQAMKDMIGDIKKDPSLLYRLSSLAAGEGPPAFNLGALGGNDNVNNNSSGNKKMLLHSNALHALSSVRTSIEVDDDHTEVSSLGMMSSDDYNSGKYHSVGYHQNQIHQFGQFSPSGGLGQTGVQESMLSRTNRDVEIALRMQSLRAKRGLFNASQGVVSQYRPPQQQQQSQQLVGQSSVNVKQLNHATPQSGNAKVSAGYRSSLTPQNQESGPKSEEKMECKSSSEEPSLMSLKNGDQIHRSTSVSPDETTEAKVSAKFYKSNKQRATSSEIEERESSLEEKAERKPVPFRQGSVAPQPEDKKQQTLTSGASRDHEASESSRRKGQDTIDQEKVKADQDDCDSQNSALVVYNDEHSPDITPHKGNRKFLSEALAPATDSRGYNNYALPFQNRDNDVARLDSDYHSAVSKYGHASGHNSKSKLDRKLDQLNRSSSRSTSRHSENDKKQKPRSDSLRTLSIERTDSGGSTNSRQSAVSERRSSRSERPPIATQDRREKVRKSKRSDASRRSRSQSESRRTERVNHRDSDHRPPSSHLVDGNTSLSSSRGIKVSEDDLSFEPKEGTQDKTRRSAKSRPAHTKEARSSYTSKDYDETENVDKVSSLPVMSFDSSYVSLSDYLPPQREGLGEQLHRLNLRHASEGLHHDSESQSGRSVISRISHLVKSKTSKLGSESVCSQSQPSSAHDLLSSYDGNSSPKKSIESDDGSANQKSGRKLISRISHSRIPHLGGGLSSPQQTQRRRTTTLDNMNSSLTPSDWERNTIRSAGAGESGEPFITNEHGDTFGLRTKLAESIGDEMARLCDEKGRCVFHPHIRLQKPKLFGGWRIIFKHCPDCAVEHMKKTQKELAIQQLKAKKKKHKEKKDNFINEICEVSVEDNGKKSRKQTTTLKHDDTPTSDHADARQMKSKTSEHPQAINELTARPSRTSETERKEHASEPEKVLAIVEKKTPKRKKVNGLPWSDYNGQSGRYTGEVNEEFLPHGLGEMVYDRGVVSSGIWYKGVLDTEVPITQDEYVPERLQSFSVGDKGRDEDMIVDSKRATAAAVTLLRVSDAAFVRRSDGTWTYAVVKERTEGADASIKFKVNARGSTKSFPMSQWGTYIRRIKRQNDAPAKKAITLDQFLMNNRSNIGSSHSVAGNLLLGPSDHSVSSARSAPIMNRSKAMDNLTTGKMNIRTRSRSRSKNRKNVTTLPLLFSSSMSVSEENEGNDNDGWDTASGSGYRLRGIDP
eukprot:CCRYP_011193-RB/>CCRYP_011193-RB protein AED:0.05 eAED:0.05 QI:315/1/1/1/0.5/0.2/5/3172/1307